MKRFKPFIPILVLQFLIAFGSVAFGAWTSPRTWATSELVTASIMNTHVRDNLSALRDGGIAIASQAAGDVPYASSSTQLARGTLGWITATTRLNLGGSTSSFAAVRNTAGVLEAVLADNSAYAPFVAQTVTLNGGLLSFPATQVPSATANILDDYEENTWTPSILFGGAAVSVTYGAVGGEYVKVGRLVYAAGSITLTNKGVSTGAVTIAGLPFTVKNATGAGGGVNVGQWNSLAAGITTTPGGIPVINTTTFQITKGGAGSAAAMLDTDVTNTSVLSFTVVYVAST